MRLAIRLTYYSAATTTMSLDAMTRTAVAADLSFPLKSVDNYLDLIYFSLNDVPTLAPNTYLLTLGSLDLRKEQINCCTKFVRLR